MEQQQMGFKSALWGFNKNDVLACIDRMAAESLEQQQQAEARAAELQAEMGLLRSDKYALQGQLEEFRQQAEQEGQRADAAENRAVALGEQLTNMEKKADDFKRRLFVREEEAVVLRRDNTRLTQTLSEKQQELEEMLAQLNAARQECEEKLTRMQQQAEAAVAQAAADADSRVQNAEQVAARSIEQSRTQAQEDIRAAARRAEASVRQAQQQAAEATAEADRRTAAAQQAAEQRARRAEQAAAAQLAVQKAQLDRQTVQAQEQMADSAALIAENLAIVKRDLAAVDARILEVTAELQRSTQALAVALAQAEQSIESLGGRMERFPRSDLETPADPARSAAATQPAAGEKPAAQPVVRVKPRRPAGLSDILLDKLAKMLGE